MTFGSRSRARSLELGLALALGLSFAFALHIPFESGLFSVIDRPDLRSYTAFIAISMAAWFILASCLGLSAAIVDDRRSGLWPLRLGLANVGTLTIVSTASYIWSGYVFSQLTTVLAWLMFSILGAMLSGAARRWATGRSGLGRRELAPEDETALPIQDSFDYEVTKRGFDIVGASLLLIAAAPLLAAWCAWAAFCSTGPVLIRQQRVGRQGRRFNLLKLRTLPQETLATADRDWSVPAASNAMSFVRRTGLDELPQLWNVLRGEMSLVGPRPERPFFVERFSETLPDYPKRHRAHPGLTGWAQIHGLRGGDSSIAERLEYDLHYLRHWSLSLDAWILLMTVWAVFRDLFAAEGLREESAQMTSRP